MADLDKGPWAIALVGVASCAMSALWWYDGVSRDEARRAAAAAPVAPRVVTPSAPFEAHPAAWALPAKVRRPVDGEAAGPVAAAWLTAERNNGSLARQFYFAAGSARTDRLLRNTALNPNDIQLSFAVVDRLQQVLDERQPRLRQSTLDLTKVVARACDRLRTQRGGVALTIELVPPEQREQFLADAWQYYQAIPDPEFRSLEERRASALSVYLKVKAAELVPGAVKSYESDGVSHAVTLDQLGDEVREAAARLRTQKRELLVAVMQWALDEGLTSEPYLVGVLRYFDEFAAADPYVGR